MILVDKMTSTEHFRISSELFLGCECDTDEDGFGSISALCDDDGDQSLPKSLGSEHSLSSWRCIDDPNQRTMVLSEDCPVNFAIRALMRKNIRRVEVADEAASEDSPRGDSPDRRKRYVSLADLVRLFNIAPSAPIKETFSLVLNDNNHDINDRCSEMEE